MKKKIKILNKVFDKPITCLTAYSASIAKLLRWQYRHNIGW